MAFVPVTNVAEFNVRQTLFGQQIENTLYLKNPSAWDATSLALAATMVRTWWIASVVPHLSNAVAFREVFARDLTTASGIEASDTTGAGTLGGFDGTSSPGNVAMAVSFRTGHAGRSYRGRNYISGIPVADVEGNGISPYWAAAIVAAFEGFITEAVSSGFAWVVVSTIAEGVLRELGVASPVIAAAVTDLAIDSMRRRLSGRGS